MKKNNSHYLAALLLTAFANCAQADDPPTTEIVIPETGISIRQEWRKDNDPQKPYHRIGSPAFIARHCEKDGKPLNIITKEHWIQNGQFHRTDGPAITARDCNGRITAQEWWIDGTLIKSQPN